MPRQAKVEGRFSSCAAGDKGDLTLSLLALTYFAPQSGPQVVRDIRRRVWSIKPGR